VSRRDLVLLLAVALVAGLLGVALGMVRYGAGPLAQTSLGRSLDGLGSAPLGEPVPAFVVAGLDGEPRHVPVPGRATLVNYWASWCAPCTTEMPLLSAYAATQGGRGIQVVGIALDDADAARAFLAARPVGFPTAVEAPAASDSSVQLGNRRGILPYSVLIDAQGRLRARRAGAFVDAADLLGWVAEAGIEPAPAGR
jgi:thiol-disulfide isomerase/thioredoxin